MREKMKKVTLGIVVMVFMNISAHSAGDLGKVVAIVGDVDITSVSTGRKFIPEVNSSITNDYKIRTGKKSFMEILLHDGTKIFVREISVLQISSLKIEESDPPTRLHMLTGKARITIKKTFRDRSFILRTPTAVAGVRGTDFGVICTRDETKMVVFNGKVEVASAEENIVKSFLVKEKEEVSVKKNVPPTEPQTVPVEILETWFDYYDIDERNRIIRKSRREGGIIDNLIRKKDF
jgi:hypothetical protein